MHDSNPRRESAWWQRLLILPETMAARFGRSHCSLTVVLVLALRAKSCRAVMVVHLSSLTGSKARGSAILKMKKDHLGES